MNFQRYLSAKRTVDDRALNRRVEGRLADELQDHGERGPGQHDEPGSLRALEVGAGIGATVERLLARPWLPDRVAYTAIDLRPENVAAMRARLPERGAAMGYAVREREERLVFVRGKRRFALDFVVGDAFDLLDASDREWDLVVAQAFADLVDPVRALSAFRGALAPDGVAYLPITFDGGTVFEPTADADRAFEERLIRQFHRRLDRSGDSRAGRNLLSEASRSGDLLAAGGADWVVRPRTGEYPGDESYFLQCIVELVAEAVRKSGEVDERRLSTWLARRKEQIRKGELAYVAHQLDLLVR